MFETALKRFDERTMQMRKEMEQNRFSSPLSENINELSAELRHSMNDIRLDLKKLESNIMEFLYFAIILVLVGIVLFK
ncbi:MAG: hypothetical protein ACK4PR_04160 [Gammaproteobacteria bacterium]